VRRLSAARTSEDLGVHLLRYGGKPVAPEFQFYICFYDVIHLMLLPQGWGPASLEGLPVTRAALLRRESDARWRAQPSHLWGTPKEQNTVILPDPHKL